VRVVGGGPVGIELGQMLARVGSEVTLVQHGKRLSEREDQRVGELLARALADDGVDVRVGRRAESARPGDGGAVVTLDDGARVLAHVVIVAAGRRPPVDGLGLETVGVEADGRLEVDDS
jgi:dihydrolipoamide dehydrogenase